jgi:hypothetical protein
MGYKDQMNPIINSCRPWLNQNLNDDCGGYLIDLTGNSAFTLARSIQNFPLNSSCTYRVISNCGYPRAEYRIQNDTISNDFDIAYAFLDGILRDDDLNFWNFNLTTSENGTLQSTPQAEYQTLVSNKTARLMSDDEWGKCTSFSRNLWVTITRTKVTKLATTATEFLNARQLQIHNGTKFNDFDVVFSTWRGKGAQLLGALSFAVVAGLAALSF